MCYIDNNFTNIIYSKKNPNYSPKIQKYINNNYSNKKNINKFIHQLYINKNNKYNNF